MGKGIGIQEPPDHFLILGVMLFGFLFEELDTFLAEGDGNFDGFFLESEFFGRWQEVGHHLERAYCFVSVFDFVAHRFVSLSANNLLR